MIKVLVDTSYLCAIYNQNDSQNSKAIKIQKKISLEMRLCISNYIFLETITVLSQKTGKENANAIGDILFSSNNFDFSQITPIIDTKTWNLFQKIQNKNISFVDCSNIIIMRQEKINKILTFDKDFKQLQSQSRFKFEIIN